jgi:hypothetical protein
MASGIMTGIPAARPDCGAGSAHQAAPRHSGGGARHSTDAQMPTCVPAAPPLSLFLPAERRLTCRLTTPDRVQAYLNALPYNREPKPVGETLRSFRGVVRARTAHCLEAAMFAAAVLEQHGFPPLLLSFESIDKLEHVIFAYRAHGRWGSIARSRDPGLHGRKPVFRTARDLARSYVDPYIDLTGCITAFAVVNLTETLGTYDWRLSDRNVWKVEQMLIDYPHAALRMSRAREQLFRMRYRRFLARYPDRKPVCYERRDRWTALPPEFARPGYERGWVDE